MQYSFFIGMHLKISHYNPLADLRCFKILSTNFIGNLLIGNVTKRLKARVCIPTVPLTV